MVVMNQISRYFLCCVWIEVKLKLPAFHCFRELISCFFLQASRVGVCLSYSCSYLADQKQVFGINEADRCTYVRTYG